MASGNVGACAFLVVSYDASSREIKMCPGEPLSLRENQLKFKQTYLCTVWFLLCEYSYDIAFVRSGSVLLGVEKAGSGAPPACPAGLGKRVYTFRRLEIWDGARDLPELEENMF